MDLGLHEKCFFQRMFQGRQVECLKLIREPNYHKLTWKAKTIIEVF